MTQFYGPALAPRGLDNQIWIHTTLGCFDINMASIVSFVKIFFSVYKMPLGLNAGVTTVLNCTIYSYQNCSTLDTGYKFKMNFWEKSSWYLFIQHLIYNLVAKYTRASSKAWDCYTCAWKSSPGLFTPLQKQHASKIQMTSHFYKTGIIRHLTHCFSSHKKNQLLSRRKRPKFKGAFGNYFASAMFWTFG